MLNLREQLAANPQMPIDARVLEQAIDLLGVQQRIGSIAASQPGAGSGVAALRERTGGSTAQGVTRLPPPERVQRFNLLFPLLWLHADKPSNAAQLNRSIDTLCVMRSGTLGRSAVSGSSEAPGTAGALGTSGAAESASERSAHAAAPGAPAPPPGPRRAFPGGGR